MATKAVKARLAPPPSQWHLCCVPIDEVLKTSTMAVRKRRLLFNVLLFLAYVISLLITVLSISPTEQYFMSNSRETTNIMFWDSALVPQFVLRAFTGQDTFSYAQWSGPSVAGYDVDNWRSFETFVQTRQLRSGACSGKLDGAKCVYPTLVQQSRSIEFTNCIPWAQTSYEESIICLGGVTINCAQGASQDPGNCDANQPDKFFGDDTFPLPDNMPAVCPAQGHGSLTGCQFVTSCGWSNVQLQTNPSSVASVFNAANGANQTLDQQSRLVSLTETIERDVGNDRFFVSSEYQGQALLSGYVDVASKVLTQTSISTSQSLLVASGFVVSFMLLEMLLFVKRLIQHPYSLMTPWLVLDIVLMSFYVILFIALNREVWNRQVFVPDNSPNAPMEESCTLGQETATSAGFMQLVGALVAMSFITLFRFMTLLPFSRLALTALVVSVKSLSWALVIIGIVYLLNSLACMIYFGPNSLAFRLLGGSFFSVLIVPEGFDVSFVAEQMSDALPTYSPIPGLYFTLVVFVLNRCVTSMVTALVALGYISTVQKEERTERNTDTQQGSQSSNLTTGSGNLSNNSHQNEGRTDGDLDTTDEGNNGSMKESKSWLNRFCSRRFYRSKCVMFWEQLTGTRSHETVGLETATERLVKWAAEDENIFRSFITFEEIKMVISIVDETTRVKINDKQVRDFFRRCGPVHIYWAEDARSFERSWMEAVNVENGKGQKYKRKKAEAIAIEAKRIADLSQTNNNEASSEDDFGSNSQVSDEISSRITSTRRLLESFKIKKMNVDQTLQPLMEEILRDQRAMQNDVRRFTMHFEVSNILRKMGINVQKDSFQVQAPTPDKRSLMTWSVDLVICRILGTSGDYFGVEIIPSGPAFDDAYREGLRQAKKQARETRPLLDRFIRVSTDEWFTLQTGEEKSVYLYFLIRGGQIALNSVALHNNFFFSSSSGSKIGMHPVTPVQTIMKDRHVYVLAILRHDERPEDDPRWHSLLPLRENAKSIDVGIRERAPIKLFEETGLSPKQFLRPNEFIVDVLLQETDTECYLVVKIDQGITFSYIEEGSALHSALDQKNIGDAMSGNANSNNSNLNSNNSNNNTINNNNNNNATLEDILVLTEVNGYRVRTLRDVAQVKLTFRSALNNLPPRYPLAFVTMNARCELIGNRNGTNTLL